MLRGTITGALGEEASREVDPEEDEEETKEDGGVEADEPCCELVGQIICANTGFLFALCDWLALEVTDSVERRVELNFSLEREEAVEVPTPTLVPVGTAGLPSARIGRAGMAFTSGAVLLDKDDDADKGATVDVTCAFEVACGTSGTKSPVCVAS